MTRQERLDALAEMMSRAWTDGNACAGLVRGGIETLSRLAAVDAASWGHEALDHLAALEADAITAYLADVPLPEGWTEQRDAAWGDVLYRYYEAVEGFSVPIERVTAAHGAVLVAHTPAHWPAIPQAVLVRAAVQCGRLRETQR